MAKILAIDDDPQILELIRLYLTSKGYDVLTANSGKQGVKMASRGWLPPDLIVVDFQMEDMNGIEVLQKIKENIKTYSIPVIMLTGMEDEDLMKDAMQHYAIKFLNKPIDMPTLEKEISQILNL